MDASLAPYHHHHQELRRLAREHEARLAPALVRSHPDLCLAGAQALLATVKAHLSMENTVLYPALLEAMDADIQATARGLEAGLGELKTRLRQFSYHWPSAEAIRLAPEAFIETSRDLLQVLRRRIDLEEARLFPLVERA
ncbi:hemerythrin domain-containing protein [Geothrix mesophila]|uniref:hemerythrin domain-containing protein n=1 Tax=Geothrix mesophila TaxID=2922723 RepID=UPI001FACBE38|nr:hemerythrin domain-containing protein [Geothrix sp. SG198]